MQAFPHFSLSCSSSKTILVFWLYLCLPPSDGDRLISGLAVRVNFHPVLITRKLDFMQLCPFTEGLVNRGRALCPVPAQGEKEGSEGSPNGGGKKPLD